MSNVDLSKVVNWPQSLSKLTLLTELKLSECNLPDVNLRSLSFINSSTSLQLLDLSVNHLNSSIFYWIANVSSNFVHIHLSYNNLKGPIPDVFTSMLSLVTLYLSSNQLEGGIPKGFQNLCSLELLTLYRNQLSENIEDSVKTLSCAENTLETLDWGFNQFWGSLPDFTRFSKLSVLYLDSNQVNGSVPENVGQLSSLETLFLSENSLSGVITEAHFLNLSRLQYLSLSGNRFSINLSSDWKPPFQLTDGLDMSSLKVGPAFPKWILRQTNLTHLSLSNAGLSGKLPNLSSTSLSYSPYLRSVDISKNLLSGELPNCWMQFQELRELNLGKNKLSGKIPSSLGNLQGIQVLRLHDNNFSGELPSLENRTSLLMVDLGNNNLSGKIPTWICQTLPNLAILRLRSNEFNGIIPFSLCTLAAILVLDLSHNNISGGLPHYFSNITALADDFGYDDVIVELVWKGIEIEFGENLAGMRSIDISSNYLIGEIPPSIASMTELISLNLSRNKLTGKLPEDFGNMKMLESLDLSRNRISGKIPTSFASLNFLSVLDLSHNNLSGRIPSGTQLQGFNASQYMGNLGLCGPPLTQSCPGEGTVQDDGIARGTKIDNKEQVSDGLINLGFFISAVLGFVTGFWMVCGCLLLKTSWRYAYFRFLDNAKDWIYVKTKAKVRRTLQR
ncbi:putative leucine-rich repeat domain, L domain-containing protein [Rosa chinensis]|uniref:Putative leucine-rich repeat domain, L domain-containing protein n=1 Tax=Rosa chinensis TaxID=74649 RepID=A0A2P6P9H8_ROSCH|nr:putative leucine-rich repeat domain, L domain-containing protein [Rosa chinensis]